MVEMGAGSRPVSLGHVALRGGVSHLVSSRPRFRLRAPWFVSKLTLVWWNLRDLNLLGCPPFLVMAGLLFFLVRWRHRECGDDPGMGGYSCPVPGLFGAALTAAPRLRRRGCFAIHHSRRTVLDCIDGGVRVVCRPVDAAREAVVLLLALTTNALSVRRSNWEFRWLLPGYVWEVHHDYPTAYSEAIQFLEKHAHQDETVFAFAEFNNYPLMFYLGDRLRFCCLLDQRSPLGLAQIERLEAHSCWARIIRIG